MSNSAISPATICFTYVKDGIVKVLNFEDAKANGKTLEADGWKQTMSFDPCWLLENLCNATEGRAVASLVREILGGEEKSSWRIGDSIVIVGKVKKGQVEFRGDK